MARGRMLNCRISKNGDVARLAEAVGGWGTLFYTWMIPHLDRDGRIHGDVAVLAGMVCPRIPDVTHDVIDRTLAAAHRIGLVRVYRVGGERYVEFPAFAANQTGLRHDRERKSEIPSSTEADPETVGQLPEEIGRSKPNLTQPNVTQEKGTDVRTGSGVTPVPLGLSGASTQGILSVFSKWHEYHGDQFLTPHSGMAEWRAIYDRLIEGVTTEQMTLAIRGIHADDWRAGKPGTVQLLHAVKSSKAVYTLGEIAQQAGKPKLDEKSANNLDVARRFAERHNKT